MQTYLGASLMTGIDRRPERVEYWSTKPFFCTPWNGKKMSLCHIQQVSKFIHFADNEVRSTECKDRSYKVRPASNSLPSKFQHRFISRKTNCNR
jgi:hypothetical protein